MVAFHNHLNLLGAKEQGCYLNKKNLSYHYDIMLKMDQMKGDLKNYMFRRDVEDFWKLDMMFKIAVAVKKLHDIDISHYDLKPANIMMMNKYFPVLGDFGLTMPN